jgi:hypothetical protein
MSKLVTNAGQSLISSGDAGTTLPALLELPGTSGADRFEELEEGF